MRGLLLFSALTLLTFSSAFPQNSTKPNVVIIYFDDMGYGDVEPYGMTGIPTPNFNKLAAEGLRFTNFNVAQAVCTASRAALLTGTYSNRIGMAGALIPGYTKTALNPNEETIATVLKGNGYVTGMLGKWHLGNEAPYFPLQYGFDSFYGLPYSHDIWPVDYDGSPITDSTNWRGRWPQLPVIEGNEQVGTVTTLEQQSMWTTSLTDRAVSFIEKNKKSPFLLYLAHPLPHVPLAVSTKFKGKSELGTFGDVIMELDWSLGEVMKALERSGVDKNTLLIVMSDNGPWAHFGNHAGSSGGFREGKSTAFEGGTRVPCMVRWPGKIQGGYVTGELMTNMDILPTICAITDAPLPANKIDGINFAPFWLGQVNKSPRDIFYYYFDKNSLKAIRYKHWKLVLPHQSNSYESGSLGKDRIPGQGTQIKVSQGLYDLSHDPGERYDVQELYPQVVAEIMKYVELAREDLGDDLTGREGKNIRHPAFTK
ncbi:sulfatase [uncultured Imperialibacter sp.]|uniref:sulfatase family protein n=1 Tax=uncultured Imperialibacter sp. TaxID=1672639 RepID=UPI0030D8FFA1|tara:strand:- start:97854 stop:99299 length:1446 start_codon:yes stop_codon:yes gene_type:complete